MFTTPICSPNAIKDELFMTEVVAEKIATARRTIRNILDFQDPRLLVIVGPCSFHDPEACLEYAIKLKKLADEVSDTIFIVMRVYVEKPRSCLGWKGYINDPYLDETYCIQDGLSFARQSMLKINDIGLPIGTEILNPMSYLYFYDLISWGAIGARTTESQIHREIASSLNMPIGVKNTTSGNIQAAANCILFASHQHVFMGMDLEGKIGVTHTKGNPYAHLVLRGGENSPNYNHSAIAKAEEILLSLNIPQNIIVDCSHGNSSKNYSNQQSVFYDILNQKNDGNKSIIGVILESFLEEGNQSVSDDICQLQYGKSITDGCINWEDTYKMIKMAHEKLSKIKPNNYQRYSHAIINNAAYINDDKLFLPASSILGESHVR